MQSLLTALAREKKADSIFFKPCTRQREGRDSKRDSPFFNIPENLKKCNLFLFSSHSAAEEN